MDEYNYPRLCFFNSLLKFVMDMIMDMHIVYYVRLHNLVKHFGCMVIVLRVGSNGVVVKN